MQNFEAMDLAVTAAKGWLDGLQDRSVAATADLATLRAKLDKPLSDKGIPAKDVIEQLLEGTEGGFHGCAGGRFFAWVIGGAVPSALAADWLTSTWDQNAALYACSPAASVVEEIAGEWIKELLHLPQEASFAFTTGCLLAHFTCLAAARASVLRKVGWDINEDGLFGAPPIRVLTSEHRHGSVDRAVRYLGMGNKALQALPTDSDGRIELATLKAALAASPNQPTILVLDAADLNIAAFDPFEELIPAAKEAGAWVHIDGAFGLFARSSEKYIHLTKGLELADSWATDGHKWLNVPFDCGIAIIRDRLAHREAMTISASYIASSAARDQIDWNPEWSRRARGIPVYAALREMGKEGVADLIERSCKHCHAIVTKIGMLSGAEMLWEPLLNQGLVRFLSLKPEATAKDHDAHTDAMIAAINADGEAFFSSVTWRGKRAMRVSVVNWRTTDEDVERAVAAVARVLEKMNKSC